jgi:phosphoribosylamine--glycine ligase
MNILLLGGGGREHALAWAIGQNPACGRLVVAPGNAGIGAMAETAALDPCDAVAVLALAREMAADLVVIGPEAPLAVGVSDALRAEGFPTFGPSQAAARLEISKAFTKEVAAAAGAPTAAHGHFTEAAAALAFVRGKGAPIVVKADGLAAGKGVTVAATQAEAEAAVKAIFTAPGGSAVIEEFMAGEEASLFVLSDGTHALAIGNAEDHKRAFDGDLGPNTGGMGAISPSTLLTPELEALAMERIVRPCLAEMRRRGTPYQGVLYAGLMIGEEGPKLVEFNARFGDPEAQVLALRLGGQMLDLMLDCARGDISRTRVSFAPDHAVTVVMAARGYPGQFARGEPIRGLDTAGGATVFHAGTVAGPGGAILSNGGRVLNVTARGASLAEARAAAYAALDRITWPGGFARRDIGLRALARLKG